MFIFHMHPSMPGQSNSMSTVASPTNAGASPRAKRSPSASGHKDKKAAEDAAIKEQQAALLALIPPSSQPPSSADQQNIFHFTVNAKPFKLMCNSNSLVGVVMDFIREKSVKGVQSQLTSRLNRVRDDLQKLSVEEIQHERSKALRLQELTERQEQLQAAVAAAAEAKAAADAEAAATGSAGPSTVTSPAVHNRRVSNDGASGDEKKEDGSSHRRANSKEKDSKSSKPTAAKGKGKKGEVEEIQRSPEEEALLQVTQQLETVKTDAVNRQSVLTRERDLLLAEERQLQLDVAWVKQLHTVGSVVPPPPRPPSAVLNAQAAIAAAALTPDGPLSPTAAGSSSIAAPSPPTQPNSVANTPASAKNRRIKPNEANANAAAAPVQPSSGSLAPVGGTFLGLDLQTLEDRVPLNLRLKPLAYANTLLKAAAQYQLVAVYALPGQDIATTPPEALSQIPIHFNQPENVQSPPAS